MSAAETRIVDADLLLEARNIVRRYPGNVALKGVTLRLHRNKVNVLIGENGAGKSTLMRILAGVEEPDAGEILLEGERVQIRTPRQAAALGIAIVHQELATLPNLDVSENIFAGRELLRAGMVVDRPTEDQTSGAALNRLRQSLPLHQDLSQLSLGCRQIVEIARTLAHGTRLLILDEPTSALSSVEADALFAAIEELKAAGITIVYISHRLHELLHLGDHFTVLRSGTVVGEGTRSEVDRAWIVQRMSGRSETAAAPRLHDPKAPVVLQVRDLELAPNGAGKGASVTLAQISLTLRRGEILGLYGVLGAGRTELLESLAGNRTLAAGSIAVNGKPVHFSSVRDAVKAGLAFVPEDRQRDGLVPELSVRENIALLASSGAFLSKTKETELVRDLVRELHIAVRDIELPVTALSGGNQQKVLLARCLMQHPLVLMLDEPTRGVDVGAKAEIYAVLRALAAKGLGILFASSEIEETRALADRVLVMRQGRVAATFLAEQITEENLFAAASPHIVRDCSLYAPQGASV